MSDLVERKCEECNGTGVAEYIEHYARPCDACHGEGCLKFTFYEDALLTENARLRAQVAALEAREARLREERDELKRFVEAGKACAALQEAS